MGDRLTTSELACVRAAGDGLRDKEIARRLNVASHRTVQRHLSEAYRKLGVRDRASAARIVRRDYADIPIRILADPSAPSSRVRPVEAPGLEVSSDDRPWLAQVWRRPPASPWVRLGLITGFAVLWILVLSGGLGLIERALEVTDRFRPS